MRYVSLNLAALVMSGAMFSLCLPHLAIAQETITITQDPGMSAAADGAASAGGCGCNNVQRPPWHGNVHGEPCGSACETGCRTGCGGVFHANPCHQLHLRSYARAHCMTMPPCFPRLHAMWAEGAMPTPVSPTLPRCHQCGAVIDGGF